MEVTKNNRLEDFTSGKGGVAEISPFKVENSVNFNIGAISRYSSDNMATKRVIYYEETKDTTAPYKVNFKQKPKKNSEFVSIDLFFVGKCLHDGKFTDVVDSQVVARDTATVEFATIESANRSIDDNSLKKNFEVYIPAVFIHVSGVIKGLHESTDYDALTKEIKDNNDSIVEVKRLTYKDKNDEGKMKPANKLSVTFRARKLPKFIFCYGLRKVIHPFKSMVKQCSNCGVIGHEDVKCRTRKKMCKKCYREHEESVVCEVRCRNCRGKHSTNDPNCPKLIKAKKITNYMSANNVGYYEAKKKFSEKPKKAPAKTKKDFPSLPEKKVELKKKPEPEKKVAVTPTQRASYAESLKRKSSEMEKPRKSSAIPSLQIDCSPLQKEIKLLKEGQWQEIVTLFLGQLTDMIKSVLKMNTTEDEQMMDESLVDPPDSDDDDDYQLEPNEFFKKSKIAKTK